MALELVRPIADELVVAVDDRQEASLGSVEDVADTVVAFPFLDSIERQWAWLVSRCAGEWVFWLDDDEIPSTALVHQLPELVSADDVTHYQVRRRWLAPDGRTYLAEPPWEPEFVPRLFRNDDGFVWFPALLHLPVKQLGFFRWVDEALYHADVALASEDVRRRKAIGYERRRRGLTIAGRPLNEAFYVPESRPHARVRDLPDADRSLLARFVAASTGASEARPKNVVRGTREEIDRLFHGITDEDAVYHADLQLAGGAEPFRARVERPIEIRVTNRSSSWWAPAGLGEPDVRLSYRWLRRGEVVVSDGLRTPLPAPLAPGESMLVVADVEPPSAGRYTLAIDLVREHVRWFECALEIDVDVLPTRQVGIVVHDFASAAAVAGELAERRPDLRVLLLAEDPGRATRAIGCAARSDASSTLFTGSSDVRDLLDALRGQIPVTTSLDELDVLVVADGTRLSGREGTRAAWRAAALVLAARARGIDVLVVSSDAAVPRGLRAFLPRKALRAAARVARGSLVDRLT